MRSGSSNEYRVSAVQGYSADTTSKMLTEIAILKSDSLMLTVAREMDLANNAEFLEVKGPVPHANLDDPDVRQSDGSSPAEQLHVALGSEDGHYPNQLRQPESEAVCRHRQQGNLRLYPAQLPDALCFDPESFAVALRPTGRSEAAGGDIAGAR